MQVALPLKKEPVLRAVRGQHFLPGLPSKLAQLLVLSDFEPESRAAVECAIELAERFTARLALMNGGPLRSRHGLGNHDLAESPDADPARPALLCLMWEVRQRGLEVGLCTDAGLPEQVWRTATERNVDLIVLPERLFGPFRSLTSRVGDDEAVEGAPCPILVIEEHAS